MYIRDQLDAQILIMCLYLSLSALHVSIIRGNVLELYIAIGISRHVWLLRQQQPDVPAYTNFDIQLQIFAPDDGLKSLKHVEHLMINKDTL